MPARNIIKRFAADSYYHVYNRGVAKQNVFLHPDDYLVFLSLFKRYLSDQPSKSPRHGLYPHFSKRIDLLSYCLMPNHIHLLVYQRDEKAMTELMRALMTSYGMYFNRKYDRVGPVFQSRYKASSVNKDDYLIHISRYIHLNPTDWQDYQYSSLAYYIGQRSAEWISPLPILGLFDQNQSYLDFVKDYESHMQLLEEIKWELANNNP